MELEPNRTLFLEHLSFIRHAALVDAGSPWPLDVPYYLITYPPAKVTKRGTNGTRTLDGCRLAGDEQRRETCNPLTPPVRGRALARAVHFWAH
jgi:hypothetical protein